MVYQDLHKPKIGLIWPRDPQAGNPARWAFGSRLKDVLMGKGPDIFIGRIDGPRSGPSTARWSRWTDIHGRAGDPNDLRYPPFFPWCGRGNKRYDFRTRTYKVPDVNTWSKVKYRNWGEDLWDKPMYVWDERGQQHRYEVWREEHGL